MLYNTPVFIQGFALSMSIMLLAWCTCSIFRAFKTVVN